jgi:ketosteroid isomerase-like protein
MEHPMTTTRPLARLLLATGALVALALHAAPAAAQDAGAPPDFRSKAALGMGGAWTTAVNVDSTAVVRVLERFRDAMAAGDSAGVLALLSPDVVVLESGGAENFGEFQAHHLAADIEFARAVQETRTPLRVTVRGDVAWAAGTSTARGQFRGRAVDSSGAELMVLVRTADGWRISAIHWSSRRRAP